MKPLRANSPELDLDACSTHIRERVAHVYDAPSIVDGGIRPASGGQRLRFRGRSAAHRHAASACRRATSCCTSAASFLA